MNRKTLLLIVMAVLAAAAGRAAQNGPRQTTWTFDRLDNIGGLSVKAEGNPKVIETPLGKAVEFDGVDDSLYIDRHPFDDDIGVEPGRLPTPAARSRYTVSSQTAG